MKPSEKHLNFYKENREEINKIFVKENIKRAPRGIPDLTDHEKHDAIETMMQLVDDGHRIRQFTFSETSGPIEPIDPPEKFIPAQAKFKQQSKSLPKINGDIFNFQVVKVLNGFVLNCEKDNKENPYIFKSKDELLEILEQTVFAYFDKKSKVKRVYKKKVKKDVQEEV